MMPEWIAFEAFGPYVKRQEIDFAPLEQAGLFLVHGKTGSGKTTVLDAMSYALFGESSGGGRGDITAMRSNFADDKQDTKVDFIFRIRGKKYRFTREVRVRSKRNGEKELQAFQNAFFMNEQGEFEPFFENPGIKNVRQKAEELLGLAYAQFRQVILLPQGKFEQLLVADSAEKEKILVTLFHAERWQEITDWLCAQALELKREKEKTENSITTVLRQYSCENAEELEEMLLECKKQEKELKERCTAAGKLAAEAESAAANARAVESMFAEWKQAQAKVAAIQKQEEAILRDQNRCTLAESAAQILSMRQEAVQLQKQYKEREAKAKRAKETAEKLEQEIKKCIGILFAGLRQTEKKHLAKTEEKRCGEQKLHELEAHYKERFAAYLDNAAGMLAETLREGKECPVCGSAHHPTPAQKQEDAPDQEEMKRIERAIQQARKQDAELEKELFVLERNLLSYENGIRKIGAEAKEELREPNSARTETDPQEWLEKAEELLARRKAAQETQKLLEEDAEAARLQFEEALARFRAACKEKGFGTDQEFTAARSMQESDLAHLKQKIQDYFVERKVAEEAEKTLAARLNGMECPDIEKLQEQRDRAAAEKKEADTAFANTQAEGQLLAKAAKTVRQKQKEMQTAAERYLELEQFSKILRGSNGVSLQRYVLGVMLSAIAQEANRLLRKVHDGRYQLCRTAESSGRSRKAGLDLEVLDAYSGEKRSVSSLSGGEKFLVSLALSLGLSAVVQAQSGGIHIDALFIDEGFGSLDPSSIENALDVLASVRGGSKMIGIISHVQMLRENIETTIEVHKERNGSILTVNC